MTCVLRAIVLTTGGGQVETTAVGTVSAGREIDTHNVWNPARRCKNQKKSAAISNGTKDGLNNSQSTAKIQRRTQITRALHNRDSSPFCVATHLLPLKRGRLRGGPAQRDAGGS